MASLPPLLFEPILKARAWGGERLRSFGKNIPAGATIGESWELADLVPAIDGGRSRIAHGPLTGRTLHDLLKSHRDELLGLAELTPEGTFPLLIKFLDAADHLSIQVHPDADYAAAVPSAHLKTEAWIVLDAEPGAVLFRGVKEGIDARRFFADLEGCSGDRARVVDHLHAIEVARGDCVYLPSGICHALGKGILVAEVQTPSDTTFRVFDWNRDDPARPLHLAEARRCMRFGAAQDDGQPGVIRRASSSPLRASGCTTFALCQTRKFGIEWIDLAPGTELPIVTNAMPVVWTMLHGDAELLPPGRDAAAIRLRIGDTALMPARLSGWKATVHGSTSILRTTLPSPLDRVIA